MLTRSDEVQGGLPLPALPIAPEKSFTVNIMEKPVITLAKVVCYIQKSCCHHTLRWPIQIGRHSGMR